MPSTMKQMAVQMANRCKQCICIYCVVDHYNIIEINTIIGWLREGMLLHNVFQMLTIPLSYYTNLVSLIFVFNQGPCLMYIWKKKTLNTFRTIVAKGCAVKLK